jgi:HEAT repeat protein
MWLVRFEAAASLGKIKDPLAIEPLRDALNDKDSSVRAAAEGALNAIELR